MDNLTGETTLGELAAIAAARGIDPDRFIAGILQQAAGYVDSETIAERLGRSVYTVRKYAQAGTIPGIKLGRAWAFRVADVDAFIARKADPWLQSAQSRGRKRKQS